jgi:hypothetical protein
MVNAYLLKNNHSYKNIKITTTTITSTAEIAAITSTLIVATTTLVL